MVLLFAHLIACASFGSQGTRLQTAIERLGGSPQTEAAVGEFKEICQSGATAACALLGQAVANKSPVPILQSVTTSEMSRFVLQVQSAKWLYFIRGDLRVRQIQPVQTQPSHSKFQQVQLEVFQLKPGITYELLVVDTSGDLLDRRSFSVLDLSKRRVRVAVASCADDKFESEQKKIWAELGTQRPDALLIIGDNVYADRGFLPSSLDGEKMRRRYTETRGRLGLFFLNPLIPTLATWDDHDFGMNDGDRTFALKEEAKRIFMQFYAQENPAGNFERGPGVASWWSAFGVHFALLDNRFYRSPNRVAGADQTHFGVDQENWLQNKLSMAKSPVFMISGDQFFGGYHKFESYQGSHPLSFQAQVKQWRKAKAPLIFVSGDRHLSEILKVPSEVFGYPTFELTSSGIHAKTYADAFDRFPTATRLTGVAGELNYLIVEIVESAQNLLQLDVQSFGLNKKLHFQKTLTVRRQ